MKKVMLTLVGIAMMGVVAVNAQDSTQQTQPVSPTLQINQQIPQDFSLITVDEIPASLKTSLTGAEYTGWEQGSFYRNRTTNQYLVRVGTGNDQKSYYFDKNGKRAKDAPKKQE